MTDAYLLVDSNEASGTPELAEHADRVEDLSEHVRGHYRPDLALAWPDDTVITFERKRFPDWVQSFHDGKLARQTSYVDGLIVERSPFFDPDDYRYEEHVIEAAEKRYWHYESQMWATMRSDVLDTIDYLRYYAGKHPDDLEIRENLVVPDAPTKREQFLAIHDNINPRRALDENDGITDVGDRLEDLVDWQRVVAAMNLPEWQSVNGIGEKTVQGVREAFLDD